jgi:hypothetical protein
VKLITATLALLLVLSTPAVARQFTTAIPNTDSPVSLDVCDIQAINMGSDRDYFFVRTRLINNDARTATAVRVVIQRVDQFGQADGLGWHKDFTGTYGRSIEIVAPIFHLLSIGAASYDGDLTCTITNVKFADGSMWKLGDPNPKATLHPPGVL